uniref:Putative secreted protein n=1 Tax=Ixodes ricinus TaxID=34613 RepID=A0A6B0U4H0_IXORI
MIGRTGPGWRMLLRSVHWLGATAQWIMVLLHWPSRGHVASGPLLLHLCKQGHTIRGFPDRKLAKSPRQQRAIHAFAPRRFPETPA